MAPGRIGREPRADGARMRREQPVSAGMVRAARHARVDQAGRGRREIYPGAGTVFRKHAEGLSSGIIITITPNEPCHHIAFLFPYAGAPWLSQRWSRTICEKAYGLGPEGLCGNEDVGQMSAWYVLAASGFHPVAPGDGIYIITSPVFDKITPCILDPVLLPAKPSQSSRTATRRRISISNRRSSTANRSTARGYAIRKSPTEERWSW